ncbi:MAG: F0F1 ATP synthase subunit B [Elusimicrobia bacterium]|nr:F0F1 ATP synthase subunit B [Elusimicrobiota bacterium]
MQQLFTPDFGLMIWTVVTFLLLVLILGRYGWRPLIDAIEARERTLREEREAAEKARLEAQRIEAELKAGLAAIDAKAQQVMARAAQEAEALRQKHTAQAQADAKRLLDKARAELEEEKRRLVVELRSEVGRLAIAATEKIVRKTVDEGVQKGAL